MKYLFLHPNFPGQFLHLVTILAAQGDNEVVFLTKQTTRTIPGVRQVVYAEPTDAFPPGHPYLSSVERAVRHGQAVRDAAMALKRAGFIPDLVVGHSGWGPLMFMRDVFPKTTLIGYFEWFTNSQGAEIGFAQNDEPNLDTRFAARVSNAPILMDLDHCAAGFTPTFWQRRQFPALYHEKIEVLHDGIMTDYFVPNEDRNRLLTELGLPIGENAEVITYVGRGMEAYRGFPQLMQALERVFRRRPNCHAVIVGADRIAYGGPRPPQGKTYKEFMLEELELDPRRLHFTGVLPREQYLRVLQLSSVHVYLTYPFVLSWSVLEAMAAGCLLVASATPPVQEVIVDGENGLLTDFFDVEALALRIEEALERKRELTKLRRKARETVVQHYSLPQQLARQLSFLQRVNAV